VDRRERVRREGILLVSYDPYHEAQRLIGLRLYASIDDLLHSLGQVVLLKVLLD
jgi:hypothetical protein